VILNLCSTLNLTRTRVVKSQLQIYKKKGHEIPHPQKMQINIKTLSGGINKLDVEETDKITYLKQLIQEKVGIAVQQQRLVMNGKILPDDKTVKDVALKAGDTVQLILQLKGGCF